MSRRRLLVIKCVAAVVLLVSFTCAMYVAPRRGCTFQYEEYKFWIDYQSVFAAIAILALLVLIGVSLHERKKNGKS